MGEVAMTSTGLLHKIHLLFNNPLFSDIQFVFIGDNKEESQKIYGHKLILALRSRAFAYMFFEKKDERPVIRVSADKRSSFYLLLRFLYTDDVQFHTYEEAKDLYELANAYDVEELVEKCHNYISQDKLTVKNLFPRYEYALKKNTVSILKDCRDFVCSNTQLILKSDNFFSASSEVVADIVKQDHLLVSSELDVINAVIAWGTENMKRNKIPYGDRHLKESIEHFMKDLRFLTLSLSELEDLVKRFNMFNAFECVKLTQKILDPDSNVQLPQGICHITAKRSSFSNNEVSFNNLHSELVRSNSSKSKISDSPKSLSNDENKISYEVKCYKETNFSSLSKQKSNSSFTISEPFLVPNLVHNVSQNQLRDFLFCLTESKPSFGSSFCKDVKCSAIFKMKSGNIRLYGFQLKIKNKTATDELKVCVYSEGFSQPFSETYKKELCHDVLTVKFSKPLVLKEGTKGELEVSIDDLMPNRCSISSNDKYQLNNGLRFACEVYLKSNTKTDGGFLFLIHKLIYVPF